VHRSQVIKNASDTLAQTRYGSDALSIQIAQIGNDSGARAFLEEIDEHPVIGDLVDCTSASLLLPLVLVVAVAVVVESSLESNPAVSRLTDFLPRPLLARRQLRGRGGQLPPHVGPAALAVRPPFRPEPRRRRF